MLPRIALICLLAILLVACGGPASAVVQVDTQTVDGITIGLAAVEAPALNSSQELIITLADAQGQPITGASVYLDLTMLTMPMGSTRPEAVPLGQGRYSTRTAYTMTGTWEITVVAEVNGTEHRALFTRTVPEL